MQLLAKTPVTVIGGTGFLGRALCARLLELGADVTAISRRAGAGAEPWRHVTADVSDRPTFSAVLSELKPQILFNLAGLASGRPDRELVVPMFQAHALSAVNVLDGATDCGCRRVIMAASLEEPDAGDPAPVPASPYAAAKWTASVYGRMYHRLYRTPLVFARVFMAYGPGPQNLGKVVPYTALALLRNTTPALSSGARAFDWVYIDDVANGLIACATAPGVEGKVIDVGTGQLATVREVVNRIADLTGSAGRPAFGNLPDRPEELVRRANVDESYALTGWRPQVTLAEGLERTVQWFRNHLDKIS